MDADQRGSTFSPSSRKPGEVAAALRSSNLQVQLVEPTPVTEAELCRAHDPEFVRDILSGMRANGFGNRSPDVARTLPYTSGALLSAARAAMNEGAAAALASGFHHAGYAQAGGFCTFNGLMVAALALLAEKVVARVAILDCDQHYGNGTDGIIRHFGLKSILHDTLGQSFDRPQHAEAYLQFLRGLHSSYEAVRPGIILYQAGADAHVDDPLGGVLTTEQMRERDRIVFSLARDLGIPIAWCLAGGYQVEVDGSIGKVVALHLNTFRAFEESKSGCAGPR